MWLLLGYIATSNTKSDVRFLLGDPNFLLWRRNFVPILLSYRDPHFGLFGGCGGFGGIWLLLLQNRTSYSCSATPISYYGDRISRLSRLVIEIPILGYLGVLGFWGYVATSGAKSDLGFLLGDPDFLLGRRNFAHISLSYRDPHFGGFGGDSFTRIDPKCNQVVPWSLHTFPENFMQIGPSVFL